MSYELNETLARKVLDTVDAGLVDGLGKPTPGAMCVEAAVCYAMGLPHSDRPTCVGDAVRIFKIRINDALWSSDAARTEGLRRLAVAQLGSDSIDQQEFVRIVTEQTIRQIVPRALRAKIGNPAHSEKLEAAARQCEKDGNREAALNAKSVARTYAYAYAAYAAAYAGYAGVGGARDEVLATACTIALNALIELQSPGCQFLYLCDAGA